MLLTVCQAHWSSPVWEMNLKRLRVNKSPYQSHCVFPNFILDTAIKKPGNIHTWWIQNRNRHQLISLRIGTKLILKMGAFIVKLYNCVKYALHLWCWNKLPRHKVLSYLKKNWNKRWFAGKCLKLRFNDLNLITPNWYKTIWFVIWLHGIESSITTWVTFDIDSVTHVRKEKSFRREFKSHRTGK